MKLSDILSSREVRRFSLGNVDKFALRAVSQLDRKSFDNIAHMVWGDFEYKRSHEFFRRLSREQFIAEMAPHLDHLYEAYKANASVPSTRDGASVLQQMIERQIDSIAWNLLWTNPTGSREYDAVEEINEMMGSFVGELVDATHRGDVEAIVRAGSGWAVGEGEDVICHSFYAIDEFWGKELWDTAYFEMAKLRGEIEDAGRQYANANPGATGADIWSRMDEVARSLSHKIFPIIKEGLGATQDLSIVQGWGYDYGLNERTGMYEITFVAPREDERYWGVGPCGDYEPQALRELVPGIAQRETCENLYEVSPEELDDIISQFESAGFKRKHSGAW